MTENIILNHNVVNEIFSSDCSCALIFSRHSSVSSGGSWWGKKAPWPSEGFKHIEENHDAPNPHLTVDLNIFQPWRLDHIWISKDQRIVGFSSSNIHPEIYNRQQRCNNYTPKHQTETWRFCFKSLKKKLSSVVKEEIFEIWICQTETPSCGHIYRPVTEVICTSDRIVPYQL